MGFVYTREHVEIFVITIEPIKPTIRTLFTGFELLFWGCFVGIPTALGIGAHLTPQDPPMPLVGWAILWAAIAGMWFVAVLFFIRRWKRLKTLRFRLDPIGLTVAWEDNRYCVSGEAVQLEVLDLISRLRTNYPHAVQAFRDCIVIMTAPSFICSGSGFIARMVAGVQDGQLIYVGWREDLHTSALQHELAHRVLQVYAGDPAEAVAHKMLSEMGIN
jgi:hypothetical protein